MTKSLISIVVPAYNESEGIKSFHNNLLIPSIEGLNCEIIYVNDGSGDSTIEKINELAESDKRIRLIDLSRNFGKELALTAGISLAKGEAIITLDSDGQHPPKEIPNFIDEWKSGAQVVIGVRKSQNHEGFIKRQGSKIFYYIFNKLSGTKLVPRSTDYRLIDSLVREEFIKMAEPNRITRGLIDWLGFKKTYVYFNSPERTMGESTYKTSALIKLALNSFTSLSLRPLFIFGYLGAFLLVLSVSLGMFVLIEYFIMGDPMNLNITGSAILSIFILFLVSLLLISQSLVSVYIARIHEQTQSRPLFIVNKKTSVRAYDKSSSK